MSGPARGARPARRTISWAAIASVAVHLGLIVAIANYAPRLIIPREAAGPPEPVIPVLIMPRVPPAAAGAPSRPTTIRLHRRVQRFAPEELPIPPLVAPEAPAPKAAPAPAPRTTTTRAPETPVEVNARKTLRGLVGCANANALGLSREERQKCEDELAKGAKAAPDLGLGIEPDKASALARAAAKKEADYNWKRSNVPLGTPGANDPSQPWRVNVPPTASDRRRRGPDY